MKAGEAGKKMIEVVYQCGVFEAKLVHCYKRVSRNIDQGKGN